eukprot:CAMPEP_0197075074 /NCGR_PEP_ID=MMETSP1384-20130603/211426_1 /TAXON_ID=29189 /ORGANISM="Ammonia sp." /LENGTH=589 /DNA_ID=CAMNT_0042513917 /DNA_START=88 /DNA_END=1857 /DNA_ORIENTATION=+
MSEETPASSDEEREQKALELKAAGNKKYSAKDYTEAIDLYSQAIATFARPEFYGNRAAAYIAVNKFKKGLQDCLSALELDANFRKAYIRGIKCYTELAQFENAQKFAQSGLEKFPNDKELKQGFDRVNIIKNKLNRIDQKLSAVSLKYDSFFESALNPQASSSSSSSSSSSPSSPSQANENEATQQEAAATSPKDDDGDEEMKEEKEQSADLPSIQHKLIKEDENEIDIALAMIDSLMQNELSQSIELKCTHIRALIIKQNYDSALSTATNVLRWNKDNNEVMRLRAVALFRNGSTDSAIKHLQQILRKDPDNKSVKQMYKIFKSIGRAKDAANQAFKDNDLDLALQRYSECLCIDRTNHKFNCIIYANRAAVWLKKKEWQNAYDDASMAIEFDASYIKAYGRRIQALYGLDRYDEAVGDAERALQLDPSSNDLKQQLREAKVELKKSKRKNYYKILGVEKDATEQEIKKGFRKMAMKWHPDKFASASEKERSAAEEKFKEIGEAYEVLKDPKLKQRYDSGVDVDDLKSGGFPGFHGGGVDISHIFDLLGGMGGGHGHGHGMPGGFQHFSSGGGGGGPNGGQSFTFRFG